MDQNRIGYFKQFAILIVLAATIRFTYSATQTINTLPAADATFIATLQTFLGNEIANYMHIRFGDEVAIGGLGATDASLTHTISAIVAFPNGFYVSQAATSHTYTATKRTFVYVRDSDSRTITIGGAAITYDDNLVFAETTAATTLPDTPTGCLPLFYADTNGTSITAVTDLRSGNLPVEYFDDFEDAVDNVGTNQAILISQNTYTGTKTVSQRVVVSPGGKLLVESGGTLTVSGGFDCPTGQQCIGGTGAVDFSGVDNPMDAEAFATLEAAQESDAPHLRINSDSWSISAAITFDQNDQIVEFVNSALVTTTDATAHGFVFSGDNAKIINARMDCSDTPVQDGSTEAALIYITGDNAEVSGCKLTGIPSVGIYVYQSDEANIHDCFINGELASWAGGTNTHHFCVKVEDSFGTKVHGNTITACVEGVKGTQNTPGEQMDFFITGNLIFDNWDHEYYGGGNYETLSNNEIYHTKGASTAVVGQGDYGKYINNKIYTSVGSAFNLRQPFNSYVSNNIIEVENSSASYYCISLGGISGYYSDTTHNTLANNTCEFTGTYSSNGIIIDAGGATGTQNGGNNSATVFTDSSKSYTVDGLIGLELYNWTDGSSGTITDNDGTTITVDALAGGAENDFDNDDLIYIGVVSFNKVIGNTITNACQTAGNASVFIDSTAQGEHNLIADNILDTSGAAGVETQFVEDCTIDNNQIIDADTRGINLIDTSETTISNNSITDEAGTVTANGIRETDDADTCDGLRFINNHINITSLAYSSQVVVSQPPAFFQADVHGRAMTLSGTYSVYPVEGNTFIVDTGGTNRQFNPVAGYWPAGAVINLVNTADDVESLNFNAGGLSGGCGQDQRCIYTYDGTSWQWVSLYDLSP